MAGSESTAGLPPNVVDDDISYGGRVFVRNTFLDLDPCPPRMPELERLRTAPAKMVSQEDSDEEGDPEADHPRANDEDSEAADAGAAACPEEGDIPAAPPLEPLYRTVTVNGWEESSSWIWGSGWDPNGEVVSSSPEDTSVAAPPPTPAEQPMGGMVPMPAAAGPMMMPAGVMLVPVAVGCLPPYGCVGAGPLQGVPPGCQAIPMDAYSRWPHSSVLPTGYSSAAGGMPWPQSSGSSSGVAGDGQVAPEAVPAPATSGGYASNGPQTASESVPQQPALLERAMSLGSGKYRVNWCVDARKLKSNDKVAVSPLFDVSFQGQVLPFKMLIHPKSTGEGKGGGSFRKAKGCGKVEVKCEGTLEEDMPAILNYRLGIGSCGSAKPGQPPPKMQPHRGPVRHNFTQSGVSGLPKESAANPLGDEWNFTEIVDEETQTFVVCLEIIPDQKI